MARSFIEKDVDVHRADIVLDHPDTMNAMDKAGWEEIQRKFEQLEEDEDIKVIVLRGNGECFSTGHDVGDIGPHHGWEDDGGRPSQRERFEFDKGVFWGNKEGLIGTILNCSKATVAQVHSYCYGGAFELVLPTDITVSSKDAFFTHPGYRYIGPFGAIPLFFQTLGVKKTKEMMLTGKKLSAEEAHENGLVNRVVPRDQLDDEVTEITDMIGKMPRDGIAMGKAQFEFVHDVMNSNTAATYIMHTLQTNLKREDDEFAGVLKLLKEEGVEGAIKGRDDHYGNPLSADEDE